MGAINNISIDKREVGLHLGANFIQALMNTILAVELTNLLKTSATIVIEVVTISTIVFYWSNTVLLYIVFKIMRRSVKLQNLTLPDNDLIESVSEI